MRENVRLRDLNIAVPLGDDREIEVLAFGLPCRAGAQLAIDITMRSSVSSSGHAHPRAPTEDSVIANAARSDKESTYPEFVGSGRCELVVLALEVGGRFSAETFAFIEELAYAKAREATPAVRKSARLAWQRRWVRLLACTAARAWCHGTTAPAQLLSMPGADSPTPEVHELPFRG